MSEQLTAARLAKLLSSTRGLLRLQGELGLTGLDVPTGIFERRPPPPAQKAPLANRAPVSPPSEAPPRPVHRPTANVPLAVTDPAAGLAAVRDDIGDCTRCKLHQGRTTIVFGVGNPSARLMFVGEGPGRDEDLQGEPFVGRAGQLLDRMIAAMGLSRGEVYIANIVKCRPPRNRDPEADEVEACEPFLKRQIDVVQPEVLVALGRYAAQTLLEDPTPISRLRGRWREYAGIPLMPTFHPAYLLRNEGGKRPAWHDLQQVMVRMGLRDPRSKG